MTSTAAAHPRRSYSARAPSEDTAPRASRAHGARFPRWPPLLCPNPSTPARAWRPSKNIRLAFLSYATHGQRLFGPGQQCTPRTEASERELDQFLASRMAPPEHTDQRLFPQPAGAKNWRRRMRYVLVDGERSTRFFCNSPVVRGIRRLQREESQLLWSRELRSWARGQPTCVVLVLQIAPARQNSRHSYCRGLSRVTKTPA